MLLHKEILQVSPGVIPPSRRHVGKNVLVLVLGSRGSHDQVYSRQTTSGRDKAKCFAYADRQAMTGQWWPAPELIPPANFSLGC